MQVCCITVALGTVHQRHKHVHTRRLKQVHLIPYDRVVEILLFSLNCVVMKLQELNFS